MAADHSGTRIVVVGTCASGKSTLVAALRETGIDAYACAQEHSEIPDLWDHQDPDFVVYLDVDLDTVRRRRRSPNWPDRIYAAQVSRLRRAREVADIVIDTRVTGVAESVAIVRQILGQRLLPGRAVDDVDGACG